MKNVRKFDEYLFEANEYVAGWVDKVAKDEENVSYKLVLSLSPQEKLTDVYRVEPYLSIIITHLKNNDYALGEWRGGVEKQSVIDDFVKKYDFGWYAGSYKYRREHISAEEVNKFIKKFKLKYDKYK